MVSRPGTLPTGDGWSFEPKYDGFRAVISTERDIRVRSRRGWEMGPLVPELQHLPKGLVLDGELVAWKGREPYFPALCRRVLNGDTSIAVSYVVTRLSFAIPWAASAAGAASIAAFRRHASRPPPA